MKMLVSNTLFDFILLKINSELTVLQTLCNYGNKLMYMFYAMNYLQVDSFVSWLEAEEKKLEVHIKTKKPIGIIQSELESFYVS